MATIIFDGNLGRDPELKYFNDGTPVCNLNVGHTPRKLNKQTNEWEDDGDTQWYAVAVVGGQAEAVTEAVSKGDRVRVEGRLVHRAYQRQDGTAGVSYDVKNAKVTVYPTVNTPNSSPHAPHAGANQNYGQGYQQQNMGAQNGAQGGMANGGRVTGGGYPVWGAPAGGSPADPWTNEAPF